MARIVFELTNRCNLSCDHCFSGRHGGGTDLSLDVIQMVADEARDLGFDDWSFTGGDPTVHANFPEVLRITSEGGYGFGFVTNGWNFATIYPRVLKYRDNLQMITFSLDGATEETHDRLRGKGSYRRVLQAMSICMMEGVPFTINMVVTAHNRHQLEELADTAAKLGARGLRYGHLMPSPVTTLQGFDLSPMERKQVDAEIELIKLKCPITIGQAPGYHTTSPFPCAPLNMGELNIDYRGYLTKCCHLSSHGGGVGEGDIIGNLAEISFTDAYRKLAEENETFRERKIAHLRGDNVIDTDFSPCWYCSVYYKKVDWLKSFKGHSWAQLIPAEVSKADKTASH